MESEKVGRKRRMEWGKSPRNGKLSDGYKRENAMAKKRN